MGKKARVHLDVPLERISRLKLPTELCTSRAKMDCNVDSV